MTTAKPLSLSGSIAAIVTPFRSGRVDLERYRTHLTWLLGEGTNGIVVSGTTGESPTLTDDEFATLVKETVALAGGKVPVIAGTGSNSTAHSIERTKRARELGADAALVVTPYYNKPTQEGLVQHFTVVAQEGGLPVVLYNVPGRTGVNLLPATVARLAAVNGIVALKEASGNVGQAAEVIARCGERVTVLSGDDGLTLPMMACGARGVISVTANILPRAMSDLCRAALDGQWARARERHEYLREINDALFWESNPIPVKTALALMGRIDEEFRLPLCRMAEQNRARLATLLSQLGLVGAA